MADSYLKTLGRVSDQYTDAYNRLAGLGGEKFVITADGLDQRTRDLFTIATACFLANIHQNLARAEQRSLPETVRDRLSARRKNAVARQALPRSP